MTEQEIVQVLIQCAGDGQCTTCTGCPLFEPEDDDCGCAAVLKRAAAALITEQRALLNAFAVGFSAVPPCKVGDTVYLLIEEDESLRQQPVLEATKVTEVGTRGFFTSAFIPPQDDISNFIPWAEFNKTAFLRKEDAQSLSKNI